MKRFSLLSLVALVFAVVYACSDSTAPANSNGLLAPTSAVLGLRGDPPPPPVDAAITVTVSGASSAAYTGTYFSNGTTLESAVAAAAVGEPDLPLFNGTAWLLFDNNNKQPAGGGTASANTRFKRQDQKLSGMGTLMINGHAVIITSVDEFTPAEHCGQPGDPCAFIRFKATVNGTVQEGTAEVFNKVGCSIVPGEGTGNFVYSCPGSKTPADLAVTQFSVSPANPTTFDNVVYTIVISNLGETDAPASEGTLTEGWSRTGEAGGSFEPGFVVPAVPAGGSITLTLTRGTLIAASWSATFTVNTGIPPVPESNSGNNSGSVSFTVTDVIG